jgi:predicted negative regulator of RcsB-dependent stress response
MAIDDLLDEHEQGEIVRGWLRENGAGLIGGVVLGLALIGGWQWWQQQRSQHRLHAGNDFQAAMSDLDAGKLDKAAPRIEALPKGAYDTLGALALAKAQLDAGKRDQAIAVLRAARPGDPGMAAIVEQRLARLLVDSGKSKDALALLADAGDDAATLQVRGDAYSALGQDEQARAAYARALTTLEVGSPQRNLVELKLSEVGGEPPSSEARS